MQVLINCSNIDSFAGKSISIMKYTVDKQEKHAVFRLEEENLNSVLAPKLKSELVILRNEGHRNLIFDLSLVKFVDSSGLSSILTGDRLWKHDGLFILTGIEHDSVKRLIEISRLDTILTIIPTLQEAIDYVIMTELERELGGGEEEEE
jgi:anti-sigma B factor antagonist